MKLSELATRGLELEQMELDGRAALIVRDGQVAWDCWKDDFDKAVEELSSEDVDWEEDEAELKAYDRLCELVPYLHRSYPEAHDKIVAVNDYNWA